MFGFGFSASGFLDPGLAPGLLDLYPATAAYSLRKLRHDYNGSAIRVRRDSDNAEQDIGFIGQSLDIAALESFVKSETTTLPADFGSGAAAAYSLRYVSSSYSGAVVRVRRSSDNAEQDFTPSEITDGTMTSWVNTDVVKYTSDYSSTEDISELGGTGAAGQSIGGELDAYKFTLSGGSTLHTTRHPRLGSATNYYKVQFDYYIPSGQDTVRIGFGNVSEATVIGDLDVLDTWTSITVENVKDNGNGEFRIPPSNGVTDSYDADGDVFYLKNIVVTQTTADGFVTTWYDQAGSNDATQATAGSQPKIYDSSTGVILENGKPAITFSTDLLNAAYSGISGEDVPFTMIGVIQTNVDGNNLAALSLDRATNATPFSYIGKRLSDFGMDFRDNSNTDKNARFVGSQNDQILLTGICEGNTTSIYLNGGQQVNSANTDLGAITRDNITIGAMRGQISTTNYWNGNLQELLLYSSDQSANRTEIEYAINDYYNIYTPTANGFVTTWYDQAGSNDATQATAGSQPKIYDSSTGVVLENGKPAVDFDGIDDLLDVPIFNLTSGFAFVGVYKNTKASSYFFGGIPQLGRRGTNQYRFFGNGIDLNTGIHSNNQILLSGYEGGGTASMSVNGSIILSAAQTFSASNIAREIGQLNIQGTVQELIIYSSDQSANRTAIETNINSYYNIYP